MKLYATIENERGKKEGMGGENGLIVDLSIGNKKVATVRLYTGNDSKDLLVFTLTGGETRKYFLGDKEMPEQWVDCGCETGVYTCLKHYKESKKQTGKNKCDNCGRMAKTLYADRDDDSRYICEYCI